MERIASRQNPLVRRFRALARAPEPDGAVLLDGAHLLQEALASHVAVDVVAVADSAPTALHALAEQAQRAGAHVVLVAEPVLAAISPVRQPSGVVSIAHCRAATLTECLEAPRVDHGASVQPSAAPPPMLLILAGVQDAGNVGAAIRSAEGCGATGIICGDGTAHPFGWKALRGAMGSAFRMPIVVHQSVPAAVAELRSRRVAVLATVARDGTPLGSCDLRGPIAVMLGGEGTGLSADDTAAADGRLTIPMRAPVESLNVAVAAALILFEASRQRELH